MSALASVERDLRAAVAAEVVAPSAAYLTDQTEARGLGGRADAVALPRNAEEVAEIVSWCYAHGVPIVPRGGGPGYAGGAVQLDGGVVISLDRLARGRSARVQVRRHRRMGDRARGRRAGGRGRPARWRAAEGRRGLRPEAPPRRIGRNARCDHRGLASADAGARGGMAGDRLLRRRARWRRSNRTSRRQRAGRRSPRVHRLGDDALRRSELPERGPRRRV